MQSKLYSFFVTIFLLGFTATITAQIADKTQHQIQLLLKEKQTRTPAQRKIDSRLLQAVRESQGKKMVDSVELKPARVNSDNAGNLDVDINAEITDAFLKKIESLGGVIIFPSAEYRAARVRVNLSKVEIIAAYPEVKFIQPAVKAMTVGSGKRIDPQTDNVTAPQNEIVKKKRFEARGQNVREKIIRYLQKSAGQNNSFTGYINSQGDHAHRADDLRNTYGYQGQGIKIGVLSDSYNSLGTAANDVAKGELPGTGNPLGNITPVTVVADIANGSDEGRAMLQIVHDVAPKAQLFFATADNSEASFATNIKTLRNTYGCDVIIDDVYYYDESPFQDGIVAQAVNTVTMAGAFYFSSAGNEGSVAKGTAGYYEGDFNDVGSTFTIGSMGGTVHNFGTVASPVNGDIITSVGQVYILTWADPYGKSTNDYDLFLLSANDSIKAYSTNVQDGSQNPIEGFYPVSFATGDKLVVLKSPAAQAVAFSINTFRGTLTNVTSGQTHGHSAAANAFSVAATPAVNPGPYPGVFTSSNHVEEFTSDGPRRLFFNADSTAITPSNFKFSTNGGTVRNKPDITAADGVFTTLPSFTYLSPFYGTSAAAPHAGAIAALLLSANHSLTQSQMRTILTSTALDIESGGYDNLSGYGIVQAYQAYQAISPGPASLPNVIVNSITGSEGTTTNNNGVIDPGEDGKITAQLLNPSLVSATNVNGTITANVTGVTITNGTVSYGTIASSASATNTSIPFMYHVASSVPCGTVINFGVDASFDGNLASPNGNVYSVTVGNPTSIGITASLGSPSVGAGYTSGTGTQTGCLSRNGIVSDCSSQKTSPGLISGGSRNYDSYLFTNSNSFSECINATFDAAKGDSMYFVAYSNNGFVPGSPPTNYLADCGRAFPTQTFSFTVAAGQSFTLVVHELFPSTLVGSAYTLSISTGSCSNVTVLPLTWLGFTATEKNKQSYLQWKVANEINVDRYEVEYSTDGVQFAKLFMVSATTDKSPDKTYEQLHSFPVVGNNYYRIKQIDKDSRFTYSKIVTVKIEKANAVTVTPNPASDYALIQSRMIMKRIQLFNSTGQLIMNINPAKTNYTVPLSSLPSGQYFIRIETDTEIFNEKIMKN